MVTLAEVLGIYMIANTITFIVTVLLLQSQINSLSKALETLLEEVIELKREMNEKE